MAKFGLATRRDPPSLVTLDTVKRAAHPTQVENYR